MKCTMLIYLSPVTIAFLEEQLHAECSGKRRHNDLQPLGTCLLREQ